MGLLDFFRRRKSPRRDMEDNRRIDEAQTFSYLMAKQMVISFEQNWDEQATANIEDLRARSSSPKVQKIIAAYDKSKAQIDRLRKLHNL